MSTKSATPVEPTASRPHGLPEGPEGLLPWRWAEQRLMGSHNYWLATVRQDSRPHMMVIWGLWIRGLFYFTTARNSRKARNLASNAYCVIGTEQSDEAVILEGIAQKLEVVGQLSELLPLYQRKYGLEMSTMLADILALRQPMYAVHPTVAFGLQERAPLQNATRWRFAP